MLKAVNPKHREYTARDSKLLAFVVVARRRGIDTTLDNIRRNYVNVENEPDSEVMAAIARDLGLEARTINIGWRDIPRLWKSLPAILLLKDGGALVLESFQENPKTGTVAILRDPTGAPDALVAADELRLRDLWAGEIVLIKRRYALTDEHRPFGLTWLTGQVLRERRLFGDIAMGAFFSTIFAIAPPFIFMIVIDRVLVNHSMSTLTVVVGAILILIVFETALGYLRRVLMMATTTRIDGRLNLYIMENLLKLPMDYFERNPTGKIASKLARIWEIRTFLTGQLFGAFLDSVPLVGLVPAMLILNWRLALFAFSLAGIVFLIVFAFLKPIARRHRRVVIADQAKNAHLIETIYGIRTIKSLALENRRRHEWDGRVAEATAARHALGLMANHPQTWSLPFERLIYSGSFALGAYLLLTSPDTAAAGSIVAFAMLSMRLAQPLLQIARLQRDLAEVRGGVSELASVMNAPQEEGRSGTGLRTPIKGQITFEDVSFRYGPGAPLALDEVSFTVPRSKMFGIMGRSGSGKTTITRLLQGLHTGYEGIIKIDGMDLRELDLNHLRSSIGVVPQENFLFSGTVRDNIGMARPDASFAEIVRAAQLAGAEEFIERMPRGYDTLLEEGAVNLSGGQRQRLAIARALIVEPPVLVLDEATSALDAESEAIINANLQRIAADRTVICVSHRLSMLVPADAIMVLERGRVYDIGTHEELLDRCDIYKHLWHQQNRHIERSGSHVPFAIARASSDA
jgi:ATP-binding cassette, subfamily B, bacterial HlyB/CyaB